jgi:hypothetical protein
MLNKILTKFVLTPANRCVIKEKHDLHIFYVSTDFLSKHISYSMEEA